MHKTRLVPPVREVAHLDSDLLVQDAVGNYYLRPAYWFGIKHFLKPVSRKKVYDWLGIKGGVRCSSSKKYQN